MRSLTTATGVAATGVAALMLTACALPPAHASAQGTVTGKLQIQGGPLGPGGKQPGKRPIPGTLRFTDGQDPAVIVRVGQTGTFSVRLAPGTYSLCVRQPGIAGPSGGTGRPARCLMSRPVTVTADHTTKVTFTFDVP